MAAIVAVAVAGPDSEVVFDGDEREILSGVDSLLADLEPGVLVTWNGSSFDLPFLADRARSHGLTLGLRLELDPTIPGRHDPLPGHPGSYRAAWHEHRHIDGYQLYRADVGAALGFSCGLKSLARLAGLAVVEVDRGRLHLLDAAQTRAYVASDARLTRALVDRRWATAARGIDRLPAVDAGQPPRVERR